MRIATSPYGFASCQYYITFSNNIKKGETTGFNYKEEKEDELLEEAIEMVKRYHRASASFLQRKLRIGYPRAARIIDQLEERGIVSPLKDDGRSREVLVSVPDDTSAELSVEASVEPFSTEDLEL